MWFILVCVREKKCVARSDPQLFCAKYRLTGEARRANIRRPFEVVVAVIVPEVVDEEPINKRLVTKVSRRTCKNAIHLGLPAVEGRRYLCMYPVPVLGTSNT